MIVATANRTDGSIPMSHPYPPQNDPDQEWPEPDLEEPDHDDEE